MYKLGFSRKFDKELRKLVRGDVKLKSKIKKQLELLINNPKHGSLRIHKLSGDENYSLSVTMSLRIIFKIKGKLILSSRIGSHDQVY